MTSSRKAKIAKLTSGDIRAGMAKRWTAPEWAIMWEVAEGTGAMAGRYADAVMMSLWPSRGLELHGVEIKISRSDWKREAADPSKAEAIAKYCDRWWVHTSPGIVDDLSDMPPAWGLREFDGNKWRTIREAEKTDAEQVSRPFLAAMLRRADGAMASMISEAKRAAMEEIEAEREKERERYNQDVERAVQSRTSKFETARADLQAFRDAFGVPSDHWRDFRGLGKAARALADCGPHGYPALSQRLRIAADEIEAIASLSLQAGTAA